MKLYTSKLAPNPKRVRMFIAEKGITDIEFVELDMMKGETRSPEYRRIAPNGLMPTLLLDDGLAIQESAVICRYLERIHPEPNLLGRDPTEEAQIGMWDRKMEFELLIPMAQTFRHAHPNGKLVERRPVPEFGEGQRGIAERRMGILDQELAGREFISGDRFTIADITAYIGLEFFRFVGFAITPEQENLARWFQTVKERPSSKA